ncbi:MAG TPA: hypothetical protein VGM84_26545 [Steroidobacteraceae bacterium]|jgi:hypothetical protein
MMFEDRTQLFAIRGFVIAVGLALLAGCNNGENSDSTPTAQSATSDPSTGTDPTSTVHPGAPSVPVGVSASAGVAQASLTWSASTDATSYHVKRSTANGGPYTQISAPTSTSYTDASVTGGMTYYYVVSAVDTAGESANSAQVSAIPTAAGSATAIPATPTGLAATGGSAQVTLAWSASGGASSYHVKRSTTSGSGYAQIAAPASSAYTDTSVTAGMTYYYVVSAQATAGESSNSAQASAVPTAPTPPPSVFGNWISVTPAAVNLTAQLDCSNFGVESVQVDSANPSNFYFLGYCQGIWKSTDYGQTWTGPINASSPAHDCAGWLTVAPTGSGKTPILYQSCIRGATGFWKSTDGGVTWSQQNLTPLPSNRQDVYPASVDPYNTNHILLPGHEQNYLIQSKDGGSTWSNVTMAGGMMENGGSGFIFFINTGNATTTANTWLWIAQASGGNYGTWRTTDGGATWKRVDLNEHNHGASQIYQPDTSGVVYMAGVYSALGWGVLRSNDYGATWSHVGITQNESVVAGTSKNVYAMYGWSVGLGSVLNPGFQVGAQPGTGTWTTPATPGGMTQGPSNIVVSNDGTHNILIGAMDGAGVWRYVEP